MFHTAANLRPLDILPILIIAYRIAPRPLMHYSAFILTRFLCAEHIEYLLTLSLLITFLKWLVEKVFQHMFCLGKLCKHNFQ